MIFECTWDRGGRRRARTPSDHDDANKAQARLPGVGVAVTGRPQCSTVQTIAGTSPGAAREHDRAALERNHEKSDK